MYIAALFCLFYGLTPRLKPALSPLRLPCCDAGGRLIYTSPLKALSAQKRREFGEIFGLDAVGLAAWPCVDF